MEESRERKLSNVMRGRVMRATSVSEETEVTA